MKVSWGGSNTVFNTGIIIIPVNILQDKNLSSTAKLLYGVLLLMVSRDEEISYKQCSMMLGRLEKEEYEQAIEELRRVSLLVESEKGYSLFSEYFNRDSRRKIYRHNEHLAANQLKAYCGFDISCCYEIVKRIFNCKKGYSYEEIVEVINNLIESRQEVPSKIEDIYSLLLWQLDFLRSGLEEFIASEETKVEKLTEEIKELPVERWEADHFIVYFKGHFKEKFKTEYIIGSWISARVVIVKLLKERSKQEVKLAIEKLFISDRYEVPNLSILTSSAQTELFEFDRNDDEYYTRSLTKVNTVQEWLGGIFVIAGKRYFASELPEGLKRKLRRYFQKHQELSLSEKGIILSYLEET